MRQRTADLQRPQIRGAASEIVIHTGKPNLEVNTAGNHFEVEMALHDGSKKTIGAIAVVYNYKKGDDQEALHQKAEAIRAEVEKQITTVDKLNGPA